MKYFLDSNVTDVTKQREQRGRKINLLPRSCRPQDLVPTSRLESTTSWGRRRLTLEMSTSELCSQVTNKWRSSLGWSKGKNIKITKKYFQSSEKYFKTTCLDMLILVIWWMTSPTEPEPCLPSRSRMEWTCASLVCMSRWDNYITWASDCWLKYSGVWKRVSSAQHQESLRCLPRLSPLLQTKTLPNSSLSWNIVR